MVAGRSRATLPDADAAAHLIRDAFEDYNARFADITRRARRRFESGDHRAMQADTNERLALYDECIAETFDRLEALLGSRLLSRRLWRTIRSQYELGVRDRLDAELYKTFFNTLSRRLFRIRGVAPDIEFVALEIEPTEHITHPVSRHHFTLTDHPVAVCRRMLESRGFRIPFDDIEADARALASRLQRDMVTDGEARVLSLELMETTFYRRGQAYLIGRVFGEQHYRPCVIALINRNGHIRVDAVLTEHRPISVLFGYTQNYFHADLPTVGDAVVYLRNLLPRKPLDELYIALGRIKQGKTERYRHFFRHLAERPEEHIEAAAGQRGMVMAVFTLPSYPLVFKVLRDDFGPAKPFTRRQVLARYELVFRHERGGRLVDAQHFRDLRFPASQFSDAMQEELLTGCSETVRADGDSLLIRHCFVERRVRPLDLFLREANDAGVRRILDDYGHCIRELAYADIFPGDLLLKNFGVTASGRVVFYDYDELRLVTECRFRAIPEAGDEVMDMSDEPWFPVEAGDVFPEQFPAFMGLDNTRLQYFRASHEALFDYRWWRAVQNEIRKDGSDRYLPYAEEYRLRRHRRASGHPQN